MFLLMEQFESYREILKLEFDRMKKHNQNYSMRSFAKHLEIAPSRLSEIFSGKQGLSKTRAHQIAQKLGFQKLRIDWFSDLVESEDGRSPVVRDAAKQRLQTYAHEVKTTKLSDDLCNQFHWYHMAIRRLTALSNFQSSSQWIARQIGISEFKVEKAVADLLSWKLLSKDENGKLLMSENIELFSSLYAEKSIMRMLRSGVALCHRAAKKKAEYPAQSVAAGIHYFSLNMDQVTELRKLLLKFFDDIDKVTYETQKSNVVFGLGVQMFPLQGPDVLAENMRD